uniref:Uncharacterized protein n=1 Tax=Magallana gigas TaxID=29159 RepID=A0A8W8LLP6_MAGGI
MAILFKVLEESLAIGDKILVFRTGWEYISTGTGKTDQSVQLIRKYQIMALPSLHQVIQVTVQGFKLTVLSSLTPRGIPAMTVRPFVGFSGSDRSIQVTSNAW